MTVAIEGSQLSPTHSQFRVIAAFVALLGRIKDWEPFARLQSLIDLIMHFHNATWSIDDCSNIIVIVCYMFNYCKRSISGKSLLGKQYQHNGGQHWHLCAFLHTSISIVLIKLLLACIQIQTY